MAEDLIETYSVFSHALVSFSIGEYQPFSSAGAEKHLGYPSFGQNMLVSPFTVPLSWIDYNTMPQNMIKASWSSPSLTKGFLELWCAEIELLQIYRQWQPLTQGQQRKGMLSESV